MLQIWRAASDNIIMDGAPRVSAGRLLNNPGAGSMRNRLPIGRLAGSMLAFAAVALAATCTTERIVEIERPLFKAPKDVASGFLGYFTTSAKQTTCGNCHAGHQGRWSGTGHAKAFTSLATANASTNTVCIACHTVSANGNVATGTAGYPAVPDSSYRDVQCESCHGPGLAHVTGVSQGQIVRPLAKISMTGTGNCADCHSGRHHPFADEWKSSKHANIHPSASTNPSCQACHDGRGTLKAWGVSSNYIERDQSPQATTCAVCHNPHGSTNPANLRFPTNSADPEQNLCVKCHLRRTEPVGGSSQGARPHAPQGAMLFGTAGYRPVGFAYDTARVFGTHATERNPKLCAGCHVGQFTVNDAASGNLAFRSTGHMFKAIPCVDASGQPVADNTCAYTATARNWQTCTGAGCHANAAAASSVFNVVRLRMQSLTDVLWIDVNRNGSIDANPTDRGYLPMVRQMMPTEFAVDAVITPAEGAEFNTRLCIEGVQSNTDNSKGTHNPFLCESLLRASITDVRTRYNLPAPPPAVASILAEPLGGERAEAVNVSHRPIGR